MLLDFLARGGHMVICSEPAIPWLPFLGSFQSVPPRPFSNIKVRVRNDPFGFFRNMDAEFDGWQGIFGQYARGWSRMPEGAIWLTDVGSQEDPKPADWLWRSRPTPARAAWCSCKRRQHGPLSRPWRAQALPGARHLRGADRHSGAMINRF